MLQIIPVIFFRLVLPLTLLFSCIVRPSLLSLIYGLLLLVWPFVPNVDSGGTKVCTKRYLVTCIAISCLAVLSQLIFHIVLLSIPPYGHTLLNCTETEYILRTIGLQRLDEADVLDIFRLISPDISVCLLSVVAAVVCFLYTGASDVIKHQPLSDEHADPENPPPNHSATSDAVAKSLDGDKASQKSAEKRSRSSYFCFYILRLSDFIVVLFLALVAVVWPCVLSSVYFLTFLLIMTWWSVYLPLKRPALNCLKIFLMIYCAAHLTVLYLYQLQVFQEAVEPFSFAANLTGLLSYVKTDCSAVWALQFQTNLTWSAYISPILLLVFYIYCAFQYLLTAEGVSRNRFVQGGVDHRGGAGTLIVDDTSSVHEELLGTEDEDEGSQVVVSSTGHTGEHDVSVVPKTSARKRPQSRQFSRMFSLGGLPSSSSAVDAEHRPVAVCLAFLIRHSYALALMTMMAWAITYHCWLSFVWLLLACVIWMATNSRKLCFIFSPFIVFYAEALLCLEFIYGIRSQLLTTPFIHTSWPDEPNGVPLQQIGLITPVMAACIPLAVKVFFCLPFWITLRLFLREKYYDRNQHLRSTGYGTFEMASTHQSIAGNSFIGGFMVKYWIYVVGLVLLLISIRQPVVAYAVCYMMFFVVLITVLQISFGVWRFMLYVYWLVLVTFSILVLLTVYVYQFHGIPTIFHNWTNWSNSDAPNGTNIYKDLGLVEYDSALLFVQLLTPISFLIVVIMQMKFFHSGFMRMTNFSALLSQPSNQSAVSDNASPRVRASWIESICKFYEMTTNLLWRIAEIHISKIVAFSLIMLAVHEVNAVNFVFVLLVSIMVSWRSVQTLISVIACIWAAAVVLAKMMFQMTFARLHTEQYNSDSNCSAFQENHIYPFSWAGFDKTTIIGQYLEGYIIIFVLLTFQAVVHLRQRYRRLVKHEMTPARGILFPHITRRDADESVLKCLQYIANYFFYKFGVEICFIMMIVDIGVRMDGVALLYAVCLLILVALRRPVLARVWYFFVLFLAIFIPLQYAVCVGLPPSLCIDYPWSYLDKNLQTWLYLPMYDRLQPPNALFLIADFFIFLFACCQLYVFNIELSTNAVNFEGGDNSTIPDAAMEPSAKIRENDADGRQKSSNMVPNFITNTKTYLDVAKMFIFVYFHWITLLVVFIAGVGSNSLFALFYLIAVFSLLWKGNDLYLQSFGRIKCRWYALLFYNVIAIILKVALQIVGCVYLNNVCSKFSVAIRLFSITCLRSNTPADVSASCKTADKDEAEILYDGLCFAFLIIQMRIFSSWYFKHTIAEIRAERLLSARGATLINMLIKKEMKEQQDKEGKIYDKLIAKTTRIREKYVSKFKGTKIFESETYPDAKRGGDYYMFDDESDNDEADIVELDAPKDSLAPEVSPEKNVAGVGPIQLANIAIESDFDMAQTMEKADKEDKRQRASTSEMSGVDLSGPRTGGPVCEEDVVVKIDDEKEKKPGKVSSALRFVALCLSSVLDHCALWFNKWSRDYRYVGFVLKQEKRLLKDSMLAELETDANVRQVRETMLTNEEYQKKIQAIQSEAEIETVEKEVQACWMEHNVFVRFLIAFYYLLVSHTELLCYIMIVLNMMGNANVLALPLPLLAFSWGTLCSPRPRVFFWVVLITYTEAMIIVKCVCQFGIFVDNSPIAPNDPFDPRRIIGIEIKDYYAAWDVALLMFLFFHRYVLKALGLWKDAPEEEFIIPDTDEQMSPNLSMITAREGGKKGDTFELQDLTARDDMNPSIADAELERAKKLKEEKEATAKGRKEYCSSCVKFFKRLLHPAYRYIMDLYAMMFLCDMICFLILAFGYSSFGVAAGKGDVVSDIQSNKVPLPFVAMLISMMILIIIDRGIYLRKSVVAKLIFQYLLVVAVHLWIFFALPAVTDRSIVVNKPAQLWYFVKCIYFLLSAWQIRNGYPSRILGNLLTKRYNLLNYVFFTIFMAAPFIFELRTLIDWIWTETCMPLFDYFSMENMYAVAYRMKCMRKMEKDYPVPKGTPKGVVVKYGMGCPILILIVLILWLPLLLFALVNSIGLRLVPVQARFSVSIEGYPPLYSMEAQNEFLHTLSSSEYNAITANYSKDKQALTFLRDFTADDSENTIFRPGSLLSWGISPPSRSALVAALRGSHDMSLNIQLEYVRPRMSSNKEPVRQTTGNTVKLNKITRNQLADLLDSKTANGFSYVQFDRAFPAYIEIPSIGELQPAKPLLYPSKSYDAAVGISSTYSPLRLSLNADSNLSNGVEYWNVDTVDVNGTAQGYLKITAFVDKVFPSSFDAFTSGGIIGVYIVVVYAVGRILRTLVVNSLLEVIITEMPNVDRFLQLCLDVFLVREARDFILELDLFAKLIFVFRSPETLIRWTRPKTE